MLKPFARPQPAFVLCLMGAGSAPVAYVAQDWARRSVIFTASRDEAWSCSERAAGQAFAASLQGLYRVDQGAHPGRFEMSARQTVPRQLPFTFGHV